MKGGWEGWGGEGKTIQSKEDLRMGFNNMVQAGQPSMVYHFFVHWKTKC